MSQSYHMVLDSRSNFHTDKSVEYLPILTLEWEMSELSLDHNIGGKETGTRYNCLQQRLTNAYIKHEGEYYSQ